MDEAALHELLSGRRRDRRAQWLRAGLSWASTLYSAVVNLRNRGYRRGWLKVYRVPVPVISLGNITTGGTGKTPFAAWFANRLRELGRRPGLISRGYRSLDRTNESGSTLSGNDEKLVLDRLCPDVPHLQQRDRVESAGKAVKELGCDALILDDGFQHRRLHRDLDIVLVDALQPWGYGYVLPRGLLRENLDQLRRADLIILTRADQCADVDKQAIRMVLRANRGTDDCVESAFIPTRLVDLNWQSQSLEHAQGKRVFAFCGIGNPRGFLKTIERVGANCVSSKFFPDHHHYTREDLGVIAKAAADCAAEIVLTTQKDLVKISRDEWNGPPLFAIEIGVEFLRGKELLDQAVAQVLA